MYSCAIHLLGQHLRKLTPSALALKKNISAVCAFTGTPITEGIPLKKIIGGSFTDYEYLRFPSEYVSLDAYLCIAEILDSNSQNPNRKNSLRVYSYYADPNFFTLLKREEIFHFLFKEKQLPFVLCVSYNNKKHTAFKAKLNYNDKVFFIRTDLYTVQFDKEKAEKILPILNAWYTIIPGKENSTQQDTFFSKQEILTGNLNYQKALFYGQEKAFEENEILKEYRNCLWFELLVHCLNKKIQG